jgi:regulator of protease activity HflC (stomatin/prohibitin superfamily)
VNHGASLTSRHARRGLGLVALAGLAVYLTSGLFTVGADEQAVVRRFGRVAARVGPGIH